MDPDAEDFLGGVGIPPSRLKAILLTHRHIDHSAGAAFLKSEFNVPVFCAEGDRSCLTRQTATKGMRGCSANMFLKRAF
jgi:glyoxylase-like metal-dependent hydrolase (beta-lactamase superfamily II)